MHNHAPAPFSCSFENLLLVKMKAMKIVSGSCFLQFCYNINSFHTSENHISTKMISYDNAEYFCF